MVYTCIHAYIYVYTSIHTRPANWLRGSAPPARAGGGAGRGGRGAGRPSGGGARARALPWLSQFAGRIVRRVYAYVWMYIRRCMHDYMYIPSNNLTWRIRPLHIAEIFNKQHKSDTNITSIWSETPDSSPLAARTGALKTLQYSNISLDN